MRSSDKDQLEGEAKDIKGRAKRQAGEWTGDKKAQAEGAAEQVAGKAKKLTGKAKDKLNPPAKPHSDDIAA